MYVARGEEAVKGEGMIDFPKIYNAKEPVRPFFFRSCSRVFGSRMMRRWWSAISPRLGRSVLDIPRFVPPLLNSRNSLQQPYSSTHVRWSQQQRRTLVRIHFFSGTQYTLSFILSFSAAFVPLAWPLIHRLHLHLFIFVLSSSLLVDFGLYHSSSWFCCLYSRRFQLPSGERTFNCDYC